MSYQLLKHDVLFYQRFLKSNGFYDGDLDGLWGSVTNKADADYKTLAKNILPQINIIEWGGNWQLFKDYPHYQLKAVSKNVASIRQLFEEGKLYV